MFITENSTDSDFNYIFKFDSKDESTFDSDSEDDFNYEAESPAYKL